MEVLLPCDLITYLNAYLNYAKQGLFGVLYSCSPLLQVYPYHLFVMYSFFFCGMTHHQAQYIMCVRRNFWYIIDSLLLLPQYPPPDIINTENQTKKRKTESRQKEVLRYGGDALLELPLSTGYYRRAILG